MQTAWVCPLFPGTAIAFWMVISAVVVWEMVWKGIALWKAGRNGNLGWFIAIFILNTLGILPIVYIFAFSKKQE